MDTQKILRNTGILIIALLWATPALADVPPNDPLHINSAGITSGELPAPLPAMPGKSVLPAMVFQPVDMSALPTMSDERAAVESLTANRISLMRATMQSRYTDMQAAVASVRSVTNNMSNAIGNPTTISVYDGAQQATVVGMAQRMSQSVSLGLGYARGLSAIGPLGLDVAFVFVGIGWILFVNFMSFAARLIGALIIMMGSLLDTFWKLAMLLAQLVQTALKVFDLFWPL